MEMTTRERFKAVMNFRPVDRLPAMEWIHWWHETLDRWYAEGLPKDMPKSDILDYFGLDLNRLIWFTPRRHAPKFPGRTRAEGLITNKDEYDEFIRPMYENPVLGSSDLEKYINPIIDAHTRGDIVIWLQIDGYFWYPREILGIENHLYAYYDQPDLIHRINSDLAEYNQRIVEELCKYITPDIATFAEDMTYNNGPMLSKRCFDEFVAPYYLRSVPELKKHGIIPAVDSDGRVDELADWISGTGIEAIEPLERQAGTDVAVVRSKHSRLNMIGGFNKMVMHLGEDAMREEFERLVPAMLGGGFIPSVDHQTPPDVSLSQYRTYVSLLHEYCRKAVPVLSESKTDGRLSMQGGRA